MRFLTSLTPSLLPNISERAYIKRGTFCEAKVDKFTWKIDELEKIHYFEVSMFDLMMLNFVFDERQKNCKKLVTRFGSPFVAACCLHQKVSRRWIQKLYVERSIWLQKMKKRKQKKKIINEQRICQT